MKTSQRIFIILIVLAASWQLGSAAYIHVKAYVAQQLLLTAWNKTRQGQTKVKPWSWSDTWPVARLKVPRLGEDIIILAGDSGRNLAFAPGHRFGTALPGEYGVSMVSAHRDTHFSFLKNIRTNDELIIVTPTGKATTFKVTATYVVNQKNANISLQERGKNLVLVTCFPFEGIQANTDLRYLVYATEIKKPKRGTV